MAANSNSISSCVTIERRKHPDGIFHPHRELHHIKKENIGLIEVMGLAVLPGRLKRELEQIADWLIQSEHHRLPERNEPLHLHADWMKELAEKYRSALPMDQADLLKKLREEVGHIFVTVLEHCGVFKRTPEGEAAFARFVTSIGMKET